MTVANGAHSHPVAFSKPPRVATAETVYPVMDTLPDGRRRVAVNGKGKPAVDIEHSTGWVCHPDDRPNHKLCKDCRDFPEQGRARCARCADRNRRRTKAREERRKAEGKRWK